MAKDSNETVLFQPHDGLFKSTMQNLDVAREVVCGYFPQEQVQLMNLNTMHLESSDFLGDDLKQSHADILYSIETKEGPGYIYTLLEHQSSPDPKMPLRGRSKSLWVPPSGLNLAIKTCRIDGITINVKDDIHHAKYPRYTIWIPHGYQ